MADVDVLVVGGGPSGLTAAAEVARAGGKVLVLEKRAIDPILRSGSVLPRPLELFDARGLADAFINRTFEINKRAISTSHVWAGMYPVDWTQGNSRFAFTLFLNQHDAENILRDWAGELDVDIRFQAEVLEVEDGADAARVLWRDVDGATQSTEAQYVVGADGVRSTTRDQLGIDFVGHDADFWAIAATLNLEFPWTGTNLRVGHNEHGWATTFPFGPGLTRILMVHADRMTLGKDQPVTLEEVRRDASEILETDLDITGLVAGLRFGNTHRIAERFRTGRVFLLGEATRIHYPASGVGMNFCIQDAFNLGWKLGAVSTGVAGKELLDTFESERRPIAEELLNSVDSQVSVQFDFSRAGLVFHKHFQEHLLGIPEVTDRLSRELNGLTKQYPCPPDSHPSVGFPCPDLALMKQDGTSIRLYEALRTSPFVVVDLSGLGALEGLDLDGLPATLHAAQPMRRPEAIRDVKALIVRPDTYVGWATTGAPDPQEVRSQFDDLLFLR